MNDKHFVVLIIGFALLGVITANWWGIHQRAKNTITAPATTSIASLWDLPIEYRIFSFDFTVAQNDIVRVITSDGRTLETFPGDFEKKLLESFNWQEVNP